MNEPTAFACAVNALTQLVFDSHARNELSVAADAALTVFQASISGSGTLVRNVGERGAHVGVLILGFAGSSQPVLAPLINIYTEILPGCHIVATTPCGFMMDPLALNAIEDQMDRICQELAGCRKVLVHVMSNNGQGYLAALLFRRSTLRSRVAAIVYDCAAARRAFDQDTNHLKSAEELAAHTAHIMQSTALMLMMSAGVSVRLHTAEAREPRRVSMRDGDAFRGPLHAAFLAHARRIYGSLDGPDGHKPLDKDGAGSAFFWANAMSFDGVDCHTYDATTTPPVPTLCLTSDGDTIITPREVADWANFLREAAPGRDVRLVQLSGTHCLLMIRDRKAYCQAIAALATDAGLAGDGPIVLAGHAASNDAEDDDASTPLHALLAPLSLARLARLDGLAALGPEGCCDEYAKLGRTAFLAKLKVLGVTELSARQKLAGAIAKLSKEGEVGLS